MFTEEFFQGLESVCSTFTGLWYGQEKLEYPTLLMSEHLGNQLPVIANTPQYEFILALSIAELLVSVILVWNCTV
jgi:hypothetical protein